MPDLSSQARDAALIQRLRDTHDLTPEVVASVLTHSVRLPQLNKAGRAATRLRELLLAEAWTEAALAWVAIEAPQWQVRRFVHDGDDWHCALSCQSGLPRDLDDTADGMHPILPFAIILAALDARSRQSQPVTEPRRAPWPTASGHVQCCDNFG